MYITAKLLDKQIDELFIEYIDKNFDSVYRKIKTSSNIYEQIKNLTVGSYIICKIDKDKEIVSSVVKLEELKFKK